MIVAVDATGGNHGRTAITESQIRMRRKKKDFMSANQKKKSIVRRYREGGPRLTSTGDRRSLAV